MNVTIFLYALFLSLICGKLRQPREWRDKEGGRGTCAVDGASSVLYADGGMVAFTDPVWLQTMFDTLTGIFDRVGLQKNVCKTVGLVCQTCRAVVVRADYAYKHRMMGEGSSYQ